MGPRIALKTLYVFIMFGLSSQLGETRLGRRCRTGGGTDAENRRWADMKEELAAAIMAATPEQLLAVL